MRGNFGKMGGGEKTGKKIRRAAAAVCEMLEQRQLLDADSYTYMGLGTLTVNEGDTLHASINCMNLSPGHTLTAGYTLTPGTADASDYGVTSGSVTLTGDNSYYASQTISIPILRDNLVEGSTMVNGQLVRGTETFTLSLTSVSEGDLGYPNPPGSRTHFTITIVDDPPIVDVGAYFDENHEERSDGWEAIDPATNEPRPIWVTASRTGGDLTQAMTASLCLAPESTAQPEDLSFPEVNFAANETSKLVEIPVIDDNLVEWKEVAVIKAVDGTLAGNRATTYIHDDESGLLYQDLPEENEATPNEEDPGGYVALNCDDDNGNGILDYLDGQQSSGAESDDDLQPLHVVLPGDPPSQYASVTFSTTGSGLGLWLDAAKTQPLASSYLWGSSVPQTIWVEGIAAGTSTVTMDVNKLLYANGHYYWDETALADSVNITTMVLPAPEDFAATLGNAKDQVKLTWTDPDEGESGFTLKWRLYGTTTWNNLCSVGEVETASHTLPDDYAGKLYEYQIISMGIVAGIMMMSMPVTTSGSGIALRGVTYTDVQGIRRDTGTQATYGNEQWYDADMDGLIDLEPGKSAYANGTIDQTTEWCYPVSYQRSTIGQERYISASLDVICPGSAPSLLYKGGGLIRFFNPVNAEYGTTQLRQTVALPTTILDDVLGVTWKVSTDGGITYFDLGATYNQLYVTGGTASDEFETVLDLGCKGASGMNPDTQQSDVVDGIWGKFSGRSTKRVDGTEMKYDHSAGSADSAAGMLADAPGRGKCTSWADLLVLTLVAQDTNMVSSVTIDPKTGYQVIGFKASKAQGSGGDDYGIDKFSFHQVVHVVLAVPNGTINHIYDPSYGGAPSVGDSYEQAKKNYEDAHIDRYYEGGWQGGQLRWAPPGVADTAQEVDAIWR